MVNMDADQLLADSLDQKSSNNGRVDSAGQSQQDLLIANLLTNGGNLFLNKFVGQLKIGDALHGFGTNITGHK